MRIAANGGCSAPMRLNPVACRPSSSTAILQTTRIPEASRRAARQWFALHEWLTGKYAIAGRIGTFATCRRAARGDSTLLAAPADFVDVFQQVGRVLEYAVCAGALELVLRIATGEQADAKRMRPSRGEHVPDRVADHRRGFDRDAEPIGCGEKEIRIGFRVPDLVACDHRHAGKVDAERFQHRTGGLHVSAGRDRPW